MIKYDRKYNSIIGKLAVQADEIWLATDPDSEGDNIAKEALNIATRKNPGLKNNVSRIWNSSLTKSEILRAFKNRGSFDDRLAMAVQGRRFADAWLGFAGTREITLAARKVISVKVVSTGRVQLPTLKRIVDRDERIAKFVPVKKWNLLALLKAKDGELLAHHAGNPFSDKKKADKLLQKLLNIKTCLIADIKRQNRNISPPIPLNTTAALSLLTGQLRISADMALKEMEQLYLNGFLSYPRTDNARFKNGFPHNNILSKLSKDSKLSGLIKQIKDTKQVRRNGRKQGAEDHDPIHPTGDIPLKLSGLSLKTWVLLTRHYIGLFMDDQIVAKTNVLIEIGGEKFKASGNIVISPGWTQAINWKTTREKVLPPLQKGESLDVKKLDIDEFQTKPLPHWSDSKLLREMEKLKIGTKSSRPDIIKKLITRDYITRNRSQLKSTEFGQLLINLLVPIWPDVVEPTFTRTVEELMDDVAHGKAAYQQMIDQLRKGYIDLHILLQQKLPELQSKLQELVKNSSVISTNKPGKSRTGRKKNSQATRAVDGKKCPSCGSSLVVRTNRSTNEKFLGCQNYPNCRYTEPFTGKPTNSSKKSSSSKKKASTPRQTKTSKKKASTPRQTKTSKKKASTPRQTKTSKKKASTPRQTKTSKKKASTPRQTKTSKKKASTPRQTKTTNKTRKSIKTPCPKCGQKLVIRTNRSSGNEFIGCSGYPKCTHVSRIND